MKQYTIVIDEELSDIYEQIARACNRSTEEILQDTLYTIIEIISRSLP